MKDKGAAPKSASIAANECPIFNCPLKAPFVTTLAKAVLDNAIWSGSAPEPHELPGLTIYLPTHESVEPLKLAFLAQAANQATFLPRIHVLGDVDPLDLFATFGTRMADPDTAIELLQQALTVPAAFTKLERQLQLSVFVSDASKALHSVGLAAGEVVFPNITAVNAYTIAGEIGSLIDKLQTEGADLSRIGKLSGADASGSQQLALQLLRSVCNSWAAQKKKNGKLEPEERRNRLMSIEAEFIRQSHAPVIIAGSTGSVAATMALMETLRKRPKSAIILHGLDTDLDPETWMKIGEHPEHPQHGLHQLLARLGVERADVRSLCASEHFPHAVLLPPDRKRKATASAGLCSPAKGLRSRFLSEALRPASSMAGWSLFLRSAKQQQGNPFSGLELIEAETIQEEAAAIALIIRDCLEIEDQTVAFVTPDEKLMRRVRHALAQWNLTPALHQSNPNIFAARVIACAASQKPEDLVAVIRQARGHDSVATLRCAEIIDLGVLRQMWRPSALGGVVAALRRAEHAASAGEARHPAMKRIAPAEWQAARMLAQRVIDWLSPLTSNAQNGLALKEWIGKHLGVLAALGEAGIRDARPNLDGSLFEELERVSTAGLTCNLANYAGLFAEISAAWPKERDSLHPRLRLWSPLDARLLTADIAILGGLNEGCWPNSPGPSPWLSRRDHAFLGLAPDERRVGQSAHDFTALATSARRVILTRSRKMNGSLTRPSRWVSRIKALAAGVNQLESLKPREPWLSWARTKQIPKAVSSAPRPEPRPAVAARPRRLSVTAVEAWFANPYAIYARHILGLEPLRHPHERNDPRDRGILYHAALHRFFQRFSGRTHERSAEKLLAELDGAAKELGFNLENAPFWRPRFARFAMWFAEAAELHRPDIRAVKSEVGGKLYLSGPAGPFQITARADRIDLLEDGSIRIYDFKTSANTARISAGRGAPQLALEGLIAREGAFAGIAAGSAAELAYVVASGGEPPGEIVTLKAPSAEAIQAAYVGTRQRISRFDDPATPYGYEIPRIYKDKAEYDPYAHLARVREWAFDADSDAGGDDD